MAGVCRRGGKKTGLPAVLRRMKSISLGLVLVATPASAIKVFPATALKPSFCHGWLSPGPADACK